MKIKTIIIAVLSLFAVTASAQTTYLDANGTQTTLNETATAVSSSATAWNDGWYVVNDDVTIADRISVSGTVNLILGNNATLTASKGITVGSDATLNIYAQTNDEATMGALVADATNDNANWYAGIGGVEDADAGTITINGGKINAIGNVGAGIGSGGGTSTVGTITINGGIVTAQDGSVSGAGIGGGGCGGQVGTINLNGGVIHAAGIGSGEDGGDCSITVNISDGVKKIVATPVLGGACIGSGEKARGSVTVNFKSGGNVVTGDAKDAVFYDTGEGSQRQVRAKAMNHHVTMNNDLKANITVNPEYALAGETVTLTFGTTVDATTLNVKNGTNDLTLTDAGNRQYTFTMPDGDVTVTATVVQSYTINLPANMEVVSATNEADADGKYITGTTVIFKPMFGYEASNVSDGTTTLEPDANGIYTVTVADADVTVTATVGRSATIDLSDANGDFNAIDGDVLTGSTSHTLTIADGAGITLSGATITGGIVNEGSATITLVGTNSTTGAQYKAGIQIGGSGTTLTINGDGTLTANGGTDAAGIGLSRAWNVTEDVVGGNIVINGGTITANGGTGGAGIGAGVTKDLNNSSSRKAIVGNITIAGGSVTAVGGSNADGIGAGQNNFNATIQIGTVTIYDAIEMVDASSIKDFASVVYMHGDDVVTASKTDYFTISENGDRRIIVPKDDTDYTITIADGIEHGTLTVAATAKYMETVTVTATPAFGYRFVRLVVKDAQNNDVASTNNTFQMPKGGATVSAEFALGSHGTTEFTWFDVYNEDCETIYDGVTTVNIQNTEDKYRILKYKDISYAFRLDNNTDNADIPYAGGTGEFDRYDETYFRIPYNGETGYYDITLTDVGNGKWGVSILPTAAQMDVVPDQTYTGSAITPEPLVIAGSLSLTKGTDYVYSYTNNTNVGTATVIATFQGDYASLGHVEKEFTIAKATPTVTAPTAAELTYTGSAQALVKSGTTDHGTLLYSLDGKTYGEEIPTGTDAGTYTVYYKVEGKQNWNEVSGEKPIEVKITAKAVTVKADDASKVYGENDPYKFTVTVTGLPDGETITYTVSRTEGEAASEYTITPTVTSATSNYNLKIEPGTFTINPKTIGISWGETSFEYDGKSHTVTATATETVNGEKCELTVENATQTDAGNYTAKVTAVGNSNYKLPTDENELTRVYTITKKAVEIVINGDGTNEVKFEEEFDADKVTYRREMKEIMTTIILPFKFKPSDFGGELFYTLRTVAYNNETQRWEAKLKDAEVDNDGYLSANTPYMFTPNATTAAKTEFVFENKTIQPTTGDNYTKVGDWTLQGVYNYKTWSARTATEYGFAASPITKDKDGNSINIKAGEFVRAGENAKIKPTRFYLIYSGKETTLLSKSATELPESIVVILPGEGQDENNGDDISTPVSEITPTANNVKVWSYDKTIFIEGAADKEYRIIDMSGRLLKKSIAQSDREEIHLGNDRIGVVIVIVGGKAHKVMY